MRWFLWRARFGIAALCAAGAVMLVVSELRPAPPPTSAVVALRNDVAAGEVLSARDVQVVSVPPALVPGGALTTPDDVASLAPAVNLPSGTLLTPGVLAGNDTAKLAPPGTVVVPVRLSDPAANDFLEVGDHVDLVLVPDASAEIRALDDRPEAQHSRADTGNKSSGKNGRKAQSGTVILASRALVLPRPQPETATTGGLLGAPATEDPAADVLLVAVSPEEAHTLTAAARSGYIGAVLME